MDIRTATQMERARRQAIAISVFLVVVMLGIATTFIALSFVGDRQTTQPDEPVGGPNQPVITANWVMPVATGAATVLKSANFDLVQYNKTANWYEYDLGYTIGAEAGTSVVACYDGEITSVVESGDSSTGKLVRIKHADGVETVYSSLDTISVKVGDKVKSGDKIGTVGKTAYYETFDLPHVRLMAYKNGKTIDAAEFVEFPDQDNK